MLHGCEINLNFFFYNVNHYNIIRGRPTAAFHWHSTLKGTTLYP